MGECVWRGGVMCVQGVREERNMLETLVYKSLLRRLRSPSAAVRYRPKPERHVPSRPAPATQKRGERR